MKRLTDRYFTLLVVLAGVVLLNIVSSGYFVRFDLTEDKRFTISAATKNLLEGLKDPVFIEVYLEGSEGDLPAGFERLQRATQEILNEFEIYSDGNVQFRFVNPSEESDPKKRNEYYQQLVKRGLQPTNLNADVNGKKIEKIIFPGAIVIKGDKEAAVTLLKGNQSSSAEERLNQSIEGIEFELASAIKRVVEKQKKRIAYLTGNGELNGLDFNEMGTALKELYDIQQVDLSKQVNLDNYDAIILAKPTQSFSEPDKFKIDQFIVKGGKALFFVDPMNVNLDSIKAEGTLAVPYELNLDDLFFKYGARVNNDLVLDMNAAAIPLITGYMGDKPRTELTPWRYYPIINFFGQHPAVTNMDALYTRFISSIDTVKAAGIKKTPLAFSGTYSRIFTAPARVSFNEAKQEPRPEQFNKSNLIVSVLLEGSFKSLYANRLAPVTMETFQFKEQDKPGKVAIFADGDLVRNDINTKRGYAYPLGFDRFVGVQFANKEFVLNLLSYILDDKGVVLAKAKKISMRPLDKPRIKAEKTKWQLINVALPIALLIGFGLFFRFRRAKTYAS